MYEFKLWKHWQKAMTTHLKTNSDVEKLKNRRKQNFKDGVNNTQLSKEDAQRSNLNNKYSRTRSFRRAGTILGQNFVSLAYGNCRDLPMFWMFYWYEKSILRKNTVLPMEKFPSLVLSRNIWCYNTVLSIFGAIITICQVVAYGRLKTKEISNFKL